MLFFILKAKIICIHANKDDTKLIVKLNKLYLVIKYRWYLLTRSSY